MNILYILLLFLIISIVIVVNLCNYKEHFNANERIVTDNRENVENSLMISNKLLADLIDDIKRTNQINGGVVGIDERIAVVIDPYINYYILKNKINCRFLNASSCEIYGNNKGKIKLNSPKKPISPYGFAKLKSFEITFNLLLI